MIKVVLYLVGEKRTLLYVETSHFYKENLCLMFRQKEEGRELCLCVGSTWGPSCLRGDPDTPTSPNAPGPGKGSWRFEHTQSHRYIQIRGNTHNDTHLPFQAHRVSYRAYNAQAFQPLNTLHQPQSHSTVTRPHTHMLHEVSFHSPETHKYRVSSSERPRPGDWKASLRGSSS